MKKNGDLCTTWQSIQNNLIKRFSKLQEHTDRPLNRVKKCMNTLRSSTKEEIPLTKPKRLFSEDRGEWEDPEPTSSHRHTDATTRCSATHSENELKTSRTKDTKQGHIKKVKKDRDATRSQNPNAATPKRERYYRHEGPPWGVRRSNSTSGIPIPGDLLRADELL